jgi:hypothetical protein
VAIEQAVDEVKIAWSAAAGADRDFAGKVSLGAGGESSHFFMPYVEPIDLSILADGVREAVEGVAGDSVDSFYACFDEGLYEYFGYGFRHLGASFRLSGPGGTLDATERFDSRLEGTDFGFFASGRMLFG